ncbi:hypothetical protein GCM10022223_05200 [Kineosporia mesophila]|uniref:Uncharacterized protein n=1 Tax=Kineosporia mesophila TaxID=566012 RepID=A0ABP6YWY5_9ACTN
MLAARAVVSGTAWSSLGASAAAATALWVDPSTAPVASAHAKVIDRRVDRIFMVPPGSYLWVDCSSVRGNLGATGKALILTLESRPKE